MRDSAGILDDSNSLRPRQNGRCSAAPSPTQRDSSERLSHLGSILAERNTRTSFTAMSTENPCKSGIRRENSFASWTRRYRSTPRRAREWTDLVITGSRAHRQIR
jgi:hypothetical protein